MDINQELRDFLRTFMRENAGTLAEIPPDAARSAVNLGLLSALPEDSITLEMNNLRAKLAADIMEAAADQQEKIDHIREKVRKQVEELVWRIVGVTIKAVLVV